MDDERARQIWTTLAPHHLLDVGGERGSAPVYYYEFLPEGRRFFFARYSAYNLNNYLRPERWDSIVADVANVKLYGWYETDEREVRFYENRNKTHLNCVGSWRDAPGATYHKVPDGRVFVSHRPALEVRGLMYLPLGQESPWLGRP